MTPAQPAPVAVQLTHACVRFGDDPPVWEGLNLAVRAGDFLTLLGPSGCGKSTVLRVMAGLQALSTGHVERAVASPAFVFQEPALLPWASVRDNAALPLKVAGVGQAQRQHQVDEVLARVGLRDAADRLPHELSGGMKMRASIARALVMKPDLLLMDEPFSALDDPTRQRLQDDLLGWRQAQGFPLCFVTHQVAEAVFMSTRVVVMAAGSGRILHEFVIDEPYPRTAGFRRSARFHDWCVAVGEALTQASPHEAPVAPGIHRGGSRVPA